MPVPPTVPALPDTFRQTVYSPSSSTGPFAVNFALYGDGTDYGNWIDVTLNNVVLVATVDYTLTSPTGTLGVIPLPITDAQITLTVPGTGTLVITGDRRPRRPNQFAENRGVPARDFNVVITDIVATLREAWNFLRSRALITPPGETINTLPSAPIRANQLLAFDNNGNPIAASPAGVAVVTSIYNVKSYGATGLGVADDTVAVNAAITALINNGGGRLYFPAGVYLTANGFNSITVPTCIIEGDGMTNQQGGTFTGRAYGTKIICPSTTATVFTFSSTCLYLKVRDLNVNNTAGSTPVSGSAFTCNGNASGPAGLQVNNFDSVSVQGFFNNWNLVNNASWTIHNCVICDPVQYGILANTSGSDTGDWCVSNSYFYVVNNTGGDGIHGINGNGGGKIINCKWNCNGPGTKFYANCVYQDFNSVSSILLIDNCSFENYSTSAIVVKNAPGEGLIAVANCEMNGQFASGTGRGIVATNVNALAVTNICAASFAGSAFIITLIGGSNANVQYTNLSGDGSAKSINTLVAVNTGLGQTTGGSTVANLPGAGTVQGRRWFVTDATAFTFGTAPTGGGSNVVPVYDDGTIWRMG